MEDFIEGVVASLLQNYGIDTVVSVEKWVEENVPPVVPMIVIFGSLLTWVVVATVRRWDVR